METGQDGVMAQDRHGRWMIIALVAVLVALVTSWAVFLALR